MANVLKAILRPAKMASHVTPKISENVITKLKVTTNIETSSDIDKASSLKVDLIQDDIIEKEQDKVEPSKVEGLQEKKRVAGTRRSAINNPGIHYSPCFGWKIN